MFHESDLASLRVTLAVLHEVDETKLPYNQQRIYLWLVDEVEQPIARLVRKRSRPPTTRLVHQWPR